MTEQINAMRAEFQKASSLSGVYSQIARKLGLTPTHVRAVALGLRKSARVEKALWREYLRIKKERGAAA